MANPGMADCYIGPSENITYVLPTANHVWHTWTTGTTGTDTSVTIWPTWVSATSDCTVTASATTAIWRGWVQVSAAPEMWIPTEYRETEEQIAARVEREAVAARRREEERALRQLAERKAEELLRRHLNREQLKQYEEKRYFELELISDKVKKRYRINQGSVRNVQQLDEAGKIIRHFCIHSGEQIPVADNMLLQKLMLEHEEDRFLRIANVS